jgi:NAD(P)-dependent dehydrogenase (short-subunit alcohol dehydrogenase family)
MENSYQLNEPTMNIIITGASSGIGYATAMKLAEKPDNYVVAIARNNEKLLQLQQAAKDKFGYDHIKPLACDLKPQNFSILQKEIKNLVDNFDNNLGEIHVLINNAGSLINKPFAELNFEDWQEMFESNLLSAVMMTKLVIPYMGISQRGHIVNIGSMGGFQGSSKFSGLAAYSASKAALANFTECLATEYVAKNVACNCLALGAVQTEMLEKAFPGYQAPVNSEEMAEYIAFFSQYGHKTQNGKVIPLAMTTP